MNIFTFVGLLAVLMNFGFAQAAPPAADKNPTPQMQVKQPSGIPSVKPPVAPAARSSDIHIVRLGVHTPSCGEPLRFVAEVENRTGSERRLVGQVEIQSEDGRQRAVQTFEHTVPNRSLFGVSATLPFQINACGTPHCYRARLAMDPDGPQWDRVDARVCITPRCTFEVTPATGELRSF
jgi:hypothetical protein